MPANFKPDPDDKLDYGLDWTAWLDGDTIDASTWTVDPDDSTLVMSLPTFDPAGKTTVWLAGGTAGTRYKVLNHITTEAGRERDYSFYVTPKEV